MLHRSIQQRPNLASRLRSAIVPYSTSFSICRVERIAVQFS
ncbi:hypothetical protein [Phormidesmis priestleyi]|nr:hypothetical protein [Phormidesmis priestleyi]